MSQKCSGFRIKGLYNITNINIVIVILTKIMRIYLINKVFEEDCKR